MGIRCIREHLREEPRGKDVLRVRKVLGYLLFYRSPLLLPEVLCVEDVPHAHRLYVQRYIEIVLRHGENILGDSLRGDGIEVAANKGHNVRELGCRQPRTPSEHHVFLRMCHPGEPIRCFVRTHKIVYLRGHYRRQCVSYDHHPQAVRECCTENAGIHACLRQSRGEQNE